MFFQNQYAVPEEEKKEFISSQHYDFATFNDGISIHTKIKTSASLNPTTVQILDEVAQGHSELDYLF